MDSLAKSVTDILNKGYPTGGCQFQIKQQTKFNDASVKGIADISDGCSVGKLKWKVPKPFGFSKVSIDRLEFDKSGDINTEVTATVADGCDLQIKTELKELNNIVKDFKGNKSTSVGVTYTGVADTVVQVETKVADPAQFTAELMKTFNKTIVGAKCEGANVPDVGISHTQGPLQVVLKANQLSNLICFGSYAMDKDTQFATSCTLRGSESGSVSMGVQHQMSEGWVLKAKLESDSSLSASVKHSAGGLSLVTGAQFAPNSTQSGWGFGFQCIVE